MNLKPAIMGLLKKKKIELSETEAIFCLLFAVIAIDGAVNRAETQAFAFLFARIGQFSGLSVNDLTPKYSQIKKQLDNSPRKVAEAAMPFISEEKKLGVFTYCLELIYADADITAEEEDFIHYMIEHFSIDEELANSAFKIMAARYRL